MSLRYEQIDGPRPGSPKDSKRRKWMKNQRNRKIRRVKSDEIPHVKYVGWEY